MSSEPTMNENLAEEEMLDIDGQVGNQSEHDPSLPATSLSSSSPSPAGVLCSENDKAAINKPISQPDDLPSTSLKRSRDSVDILQTAQHTDSKLATSAKLVLEADHLPISSAAHTQAIPTSAQPPSQVQTSSKHVRGLNHRPNRNRSQPTALAAETRQNIDSIRNSAQDQPHLPIEAYSWEDLQARFHAKINELDVEQENIMEDFQDLIHFFSIWAEAGRAKDVERSFKRTKTQMAYVQHEESQLESKRQHYIKVVDAFKSALELLRD